jgi:DNA modification methylase
VKEFPEGTTEHPINKDNTSKLLVSVWDFGPKSPVTERRHYLHNSHPAKMRPALARAILQIFGESPVLDPMAGVGTTLVEAMLLGMNAVGIDLERKFVDQANKNILNITSNNPNRKFGHAICTEGDARNLCGILENRKRFSSIILSPPYSTSRPFSDLNFPLRGPERPVSETEQDAVDYDSQNNIGAIPNYGQFNSILFSPPYGEQHGKGGSIFNEDGTVTAKFKGKFASSGIRRKGFLDTSSPDNVDNIHFGRSYLSEMLKVYSECYRILAPGKFMVLVVKDIRRNSLAIPLAADTIKLCQLAGFSLFDIIISKTYYRSFWALNRAKKDQIKGIMHPLRNHEYVLVFRKPASRPRI